MPDYLKTNIYGAYIYRSLLSKSYYWSGEEIAEYQLSRFGDIVRIARGNVQAYDEWFPASDGSSPTGYDALVRFPVIAKTDVKKNLRAFINRRTNPDKLIEEHTSGSTGNPLQLYLTPKQKAFEVGYILRHYKRAGYRMFDRIAVFRSYIPPNDRAPLTKYFRVHNELRFSVYHLTPSNIRKYIETLKDFRPKFIRGYPTSIYIVAREMLRNKESVPPPNAIFCSSEMLTSQMKETIQRAFNAPAYNWYGSNERVITASQCRERGSLHVHEEAGILEVVNEKGQSSLNSDIDSGELVSTGIINAAMPLIRYRLGDRAVIDRKPCKCGFNGLSIKELIGRNDDIITTTSSKSIPPVRFYTLFEKHPGVKQFQIIQTSRRKISVLLVKESPIDETSLLSQLGYFVGDDVQMDLMYVDFIQPEKSGKTRLIKVEDGLSD